MASEFDDLIRKFDSVGLALSGGALRDITTRVAVKSKGAATGAIAPNTLSHYRGSKTITARFEVTSDHEAVIKPTPAGLTALLEKGSGTSWKASKRRGSSRRAGGVVRRYTRSKVPARRAWTKGVEAFTPKVPGWVHEEVVRVLGGIF